MPEPGRVLTRQDVKNKRHGAASVLDKNRVKSGYAPRKHELAEQVIALARSHEQLREAHERVLYIAEHLLEHVEEFTGVIGPAGEREDDYIRDSLLRELLGYRAALSAGEETP